MSDLPELPALASYETREGYEACYAGQGRDDCPYSCDFNLVECLCRLDWLSGWMIASRRRAAQKREENFA